MADLILPRQLPAATSVNPNAAIVTDSGSQVERATPLQLVDSARPLASQADAETGTDNTRIMSPLRVGQAVAAAIGQLSIPLSLPTLKSNTDTDRTTALNALASTTSAFALATGNYPLNIVPTLNNVAVFGLGAQFPGPAYPTTADLTILNASGQWGLLASDAGATGYTTSSQFVGLPSGGHNRSFRAGAHRASLLVKDNSTYSSAGSDVTPAVVTSSRDFVASYPDAYIPGGLGLTTARATAGKHRVRFGAQASDNGTVDGSGTAGEFRIDNFGADSGPFLSATDKSAVRIILGGTNLSTAGAYIQSSGESANAQGRHGFAVASDAVRFWAFSVLLRDGTNPEVVKWGVRPSGAVEMGSTPLPATPIAGRVVTYFDASGTLSAVFDDGTTQPIASKSKLVGNTVTSTYNAAPAIIAPASTPTLMLNGKTTPGDYPELAAYRRVASQPSHQGYIQVGGSYYELMGGHACPDHFLRTGDTDDTASFLRARDYMIAKNITTKQLGARLYDVSSGQISYAGMPVNMLGQGHSEAGIVGGINANLSNFGQPAIGTWIRAGLAANSTAASQSAFVFGSTGAAIGNGAFIDRLGFVQSHPNPVTGWAPTNYDYLINMTNTLGGLTIGDDVMFLGINRGIYCNNSGRLEIHNFKGQFYTEGLYLDQALDSTIIRNTHLWTFNGFSAPVALWSQANAKAFRLFRCDGIDGGVAFILGYNVGLELNNGTSTSPGPPTDIHFDKFWADLTQYGIYNNAVSARVTINDFVGQCEKAYSSGGTALPNSAGYYGTTGSSGGLISFGNTRFERFSIAGISNNSSTTIVQTGIARTASHPGAPIYQTTGGNPPVSLSNTVGFVDDLSGTFGIAGTDYTSVISDQTFYYSGTTNSSGVASFAHGLGAAAAYGLRDAFAVCKGNSSEALAMNFTKMDGTNCSFTIADSSQFAARTFRAAITIPLRPTSLPSW